MAAHAAAKLSLNAPKKKKKKKNLVSIKEKKKNPLIYKWPQIQR